jgi:hypothetical protein
MTAAHAVTSISDDGSRSVDPQGPARVKVLGSSPAASDPITSVAE